tara:strand:- start:765 stop:1052 length:288 start_codon:yes stop_codon:yes gene_type:complete
MKKTIGKYTYELSTRKDKKLMTKVGDKVVHFGNLKPPANEHFFDKTGLLPKKLNHKDQMRRENYLARSAGIRNKAGELTMNNPSSPNYHSIRILW